MDDTPNTAELAAKVTAAWLANPNSHADADTVPAFLNAVHAALTRLSNGSATAADQALAEAAQEHVPAVTVRKSLGSPDRIISMIDGKPYRALRRHLSTHGLTPDEYRARYKLKPDYPMVAPAYSEARRAMAKKMGLGGKPAAPASDAAAPKLGRRKLGLATKG